MTLYEYAFQPFADYLFMRRALVACTALAIGGGLSAGTNILGM